MKSSTFDVMALLREETRHAHRRIEGCTLLTGVFTETFAREDYRALLARLLGFYEPFEARLAQWKVPGLSWREKTSLLHADLAALGLDQSARAGLPRCARLPDFCGLHAALGGLYVMEGATLGGAVIRQRLYLRFPSALSFYGVHGNETGANWRAFRDGLRRHVGEYRAAAAVVAQGALDTFAALTHWLEEAGARPVRAEVRSKDRPCGPMSST